MTNTEMLQRVNELALYLEKAETDLYHDCVANGFREIPGMAGKLATLTLDLRDDIARDEARKSGRGSAQTAAKRIIKNAFAYQPREYLHGAWMENGKQCLCDGYRGVILDSPIPGLPQAKTDPSAMSLGHILSPSRANHGARLSLPTIGELKAAIKIHDAEERARKEKTEDRKPLTWDFGEGLPAVNGNYLRDMLELLPCCTATASHASPLLGAIYFQAEGVGEGILLPVRKQSKKSDI